MTAERRLIIRPGAIGDTILSFPALRYLRADGGYTEIWVRSDVAPLIDFADRVRGIPTTGIDMVGLPGVEPPAEVVRMLESFNEVVSWYGANRPDFQEQLKAIVRSARFLRALPDVDQGRHAADFFLRQVGGTGPAMPRIAIARPSSTGHTVIHPFSGSERKNWPLQQFERLAEALTRLGHLVEWAARPDGVRFENLRELAEWLAGARCYVGNDSGISHLAAAVGAPVVALFGPTDPVVWGPRGDRYAVLHREPLDHIEVEEVVEAVARTERAAFH